MSLFVRSCACGSITVRHPVLGIKCGKAGKADVRQRRICAKQAVRKPIIQAGTTKSRMSTVAFDNMVSYPYTLGRVWWTWVLNDLCRLVLRAQGQGWCRKSASGRRAGDFVGRPRGFLVGTYAVTALGAETSFFSQTWSARGHVKTTTQDRTSSKLLQVA